MEITESKLEKSEFCLSIPISLLLRIVLEFVILKFDNIFLQVKKQENIIINLKTSLFLYSSLLKMKSNPFEG